MNIEARRIPPRRPRFLRLVIVATAIAGATTASTVMLESGASQRTPSEDAVDIVTAPSTPSLLYAPLAAGAVFCCFGWVTTRFKRRPTRSAQTPTDAAALELVASTAASHNSSDSIAV